MVPGTSFHTLYFHILLNLGYCSAALSLSLYCRTQAELTCMGVETNSGSSCFAGFLLLLFKDFFFFLFFFSFPKVVFRGAMLKYHLHNASRQHESYWF